MGSSTQNTTFRRGLRLLRERWSRTRWRPRILLVELSALYAALSLAVLFLPRMLWLHVFDNSEAQARALLPFFGPPALLGFADDVAPVIIYWIGTAIIGLLTFGVVTGTRTTKIVAALLIPAFWFAFGACSTLPLF